MRVSVVCSRWLLLIGLVTLGFGCEHAPAVVEPPPLEVIISKPVNEKIEEWDIYTGTVEAKDDVEIKAQVRGEIKDVTFKEGDEVKPGAPLFTIDSAPFKADKQQAEGLLEGALSNLKNAEQKIELYKPLVDKGTISKEEMVDVLSAKDKALADINTAKAKISQAVINIGYCDITAPVGGMVGRALLTKGNIVNAAAPLTTVVSVDPMYVYFNVNEKAFIHYQKILADLAPKDAKDIKPAIPVQLERLSDAGFPFKGVIDFRDNRVDPNTSSVKVRASFDNKKEQGVRPLTVGMFAKVRVAVAPPYPATLLADRAILTDQSLKYVLVVNRAKKDTVERKDITVSSRVQPDGLVAVTGGLNGDEWIIVEGVNRARPGVIVNPKEGPMPRTPVPGDKSVKKN